MGRIAVTGSSGLIGTALVAALHERGDEVVRLVRRAPAGPTRCAGTRAARSLDPAALDGVTGSSTSPVPGSGTSGGRPRARRRSSARGSTRRRPSRPPWPRPTTPSASCPGRPSATTATAATRSSPRTAHPGTGFLADVVLAWEAAAQRAVDAGASVAFIRTGIVLSPDGGAAAPLLKHGAVRPRRARWGSGRQFWPWLTLADEVGAILHLLDHPEVVGPVNLFTAPGPPGRHRRGHGTRPAAARPSSRRRRSRCGPSSASSPARSSAVSAIIGQRLHASGFVPRHPDLDSARSLARSPEAPPGAFRRRTDPPRRSGCRREVADPSADVGCGTRVGSTTSLPRTSSDRRGGRRGAVAESHRRRHRCSLDARPRTRRGPAASSGPTTEASRTRLAHDAAHRSPDRAEVGDGGPVTGLGRRAGGVGARGGAPPWHRARPRPEPRRGLRRARRASRGVLPGRAGRRPAGSSARPSSPRSGRHRVASPEPRAADDPGGRPDPHERDDDREARRRDPPPGRPPDARPHLGPAPARPPRPAPPRRPAAATTPRDVLGWSTGRRPQPVGDGARLVVAADEVQRLGARRVEELPGELVGAGRSWRCGETAAWRTATSAVGALPGLRHLGEGRPQARRSGHLPAEARASPARPRA